MLPPRQRRQTFLRRARAYARTDDRLAGKTRFFAAASLTNAVLARLCGFGSSFISPECAHLLLTLGSTLESYNQSLAQTVLHSQQVGPMLDRSLVTLEQWVAQRYWRRYCVQHARSCRSVERELDRLLNGTHPASVFSNLWGESREYSLVLAQVRIARPASLRFASQKDRVQIGCGLVEHLRQRLDRQTVGGSPLKLSPGTLSRSAYA
jgi:hypothetical protein